MLSCGALERSNNSYIESIEQPCVSKNSKGIFAMLVWLERKSWKRVETIEKSIPELKAEFVCMCEREKSNSFEIHVIVLKEPQTISIYWFYLLCNHVTTSAKSKLFVTYTFVYP